MTHRCMDCGSLNVHEVAEGKDVGKFVGGKAPYGFVVEDGRYKFDHGFAGRILVTFMHNHANGYSLRALAGWANDGGHLSPTGQVWTHSAVGRVITQGKRLAHLIPISQVI